MRNFTMAAMMVAALVWTSTPAMAEIAKYKIDASHSSIQFKIKHYGISMSTGRFNTLSGELHFDKEEVENSKIVVSIEAKSVDTNHEVRDKHLRGADYFDADKHKLITFESKTIEAQGENKFKVTGDMTFMGKTKPLTAVLVKTGEGKDPRGNERIGGTTIFTIKRSEFGMTTSLDSLSDEVEVEINIEGIKQ